MIVFTCIYYSYYMIRRGKRFLMGLSYMRFDNEELSVAMCDVDDVDGPIAIRKGTLVIYYLIFTYIYSVLWLTDIVLK